MPRLAVLLAALAASVSLLIGAAAASNPNALGWNAAERWTQTCNDEQSSLVGACVTNPMQCAWGDEDDIADMVIGKLSAGRSTSDTLCVITDTCSDFACPHYIDAVVNGGASLNVTLTSDRGDAWTLPYSRSAKRYELCVRDPHYTGSRNPADYPLLPAPNVPGSYGILTRYTLTVTAAKTTQLGAGFETAQNFADGRFGYFHLFSDVPCGWAIP